MEKKILGGVLGLCVADSVGVPYEFQSREALRYSPATDMRGYGTYNQPAGTWSDDTSMTLCLLDSLLNGLDYSDIMRRFRSWLEEAEYTPHSEVFDVGRTSREAIFRFAKGVPPLQCGGSSERDNGNGALMRVLPLIFYIHSRFGDDFFRHEEAVNIIHNVAALTHAHKRSQIACGVYLSVAEMLMGGMKLSSAVELGVYSAWKYYSKNAEYAEELKHYERIRSPKFAEIPEEQIRSSGYAVDTLEAALWCLLNTDGYKACVLKAVNLGEDTDTVAAVAGGLAGMYYGYGAIPVSWRENIARADYIMDLCSAFFYSLTKMGFEKIRPYLSYFAQVDSDIACGWEPGRRQEDGTLVFGYPVYEDKLCQFIDDCSNSGLMDYAYVSTIQEYGYEMNNDLAQHIGTADLKLTKAILTRYIRQERFYDGLWGIATREGTFLALLKRLDTLLNH